MQYGTKSFNMSMSRSPSKIFGHNGNTIQVSALKIAYGSDQRAVLVYNWTTDHVIDWLVNHVHLPQYAENFRRNQFDGRMIPRFRHVLFHPHFLDDAFLMQVGCQ